VSDDSDEAQDDSNSNKIGTRDRATFGAVNNAPIQQVVRPETAAPQPSPSTARLDGPAQSQAPFSSSQSPRWSSGDLCASIAHGSGSSDSRSWRERELSFLLDDQVDLTTYNWQQFKPQLAAFLNNLIVSPAGRDEEAFKASPRYRVLMTRFAKAYLCGEFGSFVDDTLRASPEATARFLARFRDPFIDVIHCVLVRPLVYQELCRIVATHDVVPLDGNILAMARRLRACQVSNWQ
jgi:hypothetical protein